MITTGFDMRIRKILPERKKIDVKKCKGAFEKAWGKYCLDTSQIDFYETIETHNTYKALDFKIVYCKPENLKKGKKCKSRRKIDRYLKKHKLGFH